MCRKNLNLQGRKSFYEDIHVRKFKASDLLPSHLLYQPPKPQHGLLSPVRSEQGEEEDQKALHSGIGPEE